MITEIFKEVISSLEAKNIPYMVSGSMAMTAYTVARTTRDIDIVIELTEDSLDSFCEIFKDHYYIHRPSIEGELKRRGMFNVIDNRSGFKIDFVIKKNSPFRRTEFDRRRRDTVFGVETWLVSKEDLILSKLIWIQELQSGRQMEDIRNLLDDKDIDMEYLQKWIAELSLTTFDLL